MSKFKSYILNPETLLYEIKEDKSHYFIKASCVVLASILLLVAVLLGYTYVLGFDLPKTMLLKRRNAEWTSRIELLNARLDRTEAVLDGLEMRDNSIYRSIFGMNAIPAEVRNAGFRDAGGNRFAEEGLRRNSPLERTSVRLDRMVKRAYVQSKSFDDVAAMVTQADLMAVCIPAITPVSPAARNLRFTSAFGYRPDPFAGAPRYHSGDDFACDPGNTVHATGNGVVEEVKYEFFGYGLSVVIDHGFGYKTRYAHLSRIDVTERQRVLRGQQIGLSGNSGRATGPHVHYEVIYKGEAINPEDYFDLDMPAEEYAELVRNAGGQKP